MANCHFVWKSESYVRVEGSLDGNSPFHLLFEREQPALWIDFSGVERVNSQGVNAWVRTIAKQKTKIHFVNLPVCVMEPFSLLPEFRGKGADLSSFWALYTCHTCRRDDKVLLVVGRDIVPGLSQYEDGPERKCADCGRTMEFTHDPVSFLSFLEKLPLPAKAPLAP
jgi:hypothetical protein